MSTSTDTPKHKVVSVYLPAPLAQRLEAVQRARSVGAAKPPLGGIILACVERGIGAIESPTPNTEIAA